MQALEECTVEQNHAKHIVDHYYNDNYSLMGTHAMDQDQVDSRISNLRKEKSPGLDNY